MHGYLLTTKEPLFGEFAPQSFDTWARAWAARKTAGDELAARGWPVRSVLGGEPVARIAPPRTASDLERDLYKAAAAWTREYGGLPDPLTGEAWLPARFLAFTCRLSLDLTEIGNGFPQAPYLWL